MHRVRDALGREHAFEAPPRRIVSLVPSWTETLFSLGAGAAVCGVTDYCIHPAAELAAVARVGGTKNPDLQRVAELAPDVVIANREENRRRDVERIEGSGVPVFVTYARSVEEALREIGALGELVAAPGPAAVICAAIEAALARARAGWCEPRPRVLALVWKDPYMAAGEDTFASDLIREAGGRNAIGSGREGERRYPRLSADEIPVLTPDVILLPTEPYAFGEPDRQELLALDCPAARTQRVYVFEGELLSWYGPRMARALDLLRSWLS